MDSWRLVVLGWGGVGKTALAVQFTLNYYPEFSGPTIEETYRTQLVVDNRLCSIEVIDTAGCEEYGPLRDQWIREGQGCILVYSIANRYSFENLEVIYQSMRRVKQGELIFMLVGTQCDRTYEREVSKEEGEALARQYGCEFIETSAKTTQNVDRPFINLVRSLRQTRSPEQEPSRSSTSSALLTAMTRSFHSLVTTMRHFPRVTKNYTKGYSDTQAKVRAATSNDPWEPSGTQMNDIAQLTYNLTDFIEIMEMLDKGLNDEGKNWQHVFKSLTVLDYCLHQGSENVAIHFRDNIDLVKTLKEFQYIDEDGKDQGANVRQKAKDILLQDESRLRDERRARAHMRDRLIRSSGDDPVGEYDDENAQGRSAGGSNPSTNGLTERPNRHEDKLREDIKEIKKLLARDRVPAEQRDLEQPIRISQEEEEKRKQQPVASSNASMRDGLNRGSGDDPVGEDDDEKAQGRSAGGSNPSTNGLTGKRPNRYEDELREDIKAIEKWLAPHGVPAEQRDLEQPIRISQEEEEKRKQQPVANSNASENPQLSRCLPDSSPSDLQTQSFHSTILPNLQVSVYCALTTFETGISPWMHPSEWLDANTEHIRAIFDEIVDCSKNKAITFPATMIFQRLIVYILAYTVLHPGNETLSGELNATLKKYQQWDILNQMRSQANIKNQLLIIFRSASPEHREMQFEDLFNKLLFLDSIALSANVALITNEDTYEDLVDTTGPGAQCLVNLLHARLDFPMDSRHKRLLVRALTCLSETSGLYPESLTLNDVTPEHGRRATGGFADVYKGRCFAEDHIAIKVFKMPLPNINSLNSLRSFDDNFQDLLREFITWRQLSHPNLLPFYGVHFLKDTLETRFCLVSPWMENGNVVEFLARRNRMDPYNDTTNCVCLALDIAQGIQYLHGEKIIHRDLKGPNILISSSMRGCIADFGLATLADSGCATTLAGNAVMGTPKWLAPELFPHEEVKRNHTYASDIYAFALVCYELFSGKVPFEDVQLYDLRLLLERGKRPPLPTDDLSRRRGLSPEMEDIIRDCWAQEQAERPSADKVVERLQLFQPFDERPPNEVGSSFCTQLLRDQVDNPFAILYSESRGFGLRT